MNLWQRFSVRYLGQGVAGSMERRVELLAIGLSLVLLLQVLYSGVLLASLAEPDAVVPSLEGIEDMRPTAVQAVTAAERNEISARPLFSVTRRPPAGANREAEGAGAAAAGPGRLGEIELLGVFESGDRAGMIALVDDTQQRVLLGETLKGWTLEAVHRDRVELANGGRRETIALLPGEVNGAQATRKAGTRQTRDAHSRQTRNAHSRQSRNADKRRRQGAGARSAGSTDERRRPAADARPARRTDNEKRGNSPARLGFGKDR
jgi:hypothetical protein